MVQSGPEIVDDLTQDRVTRAWEPLIELQPEQVVSAVHLNITEDFVGFAIYRSLHLPIELLEVLISTAELDSDSVDGRGDRPHSGSPCR